jgi:PAS domain S-box-containing protein
MSKLGEKLLRPFVSLSDTLIEHGDRLPRLARYGIAVVLGAATVAARLALVPATGRTAPYHILYAVVMIIAVAFGAGPAIVAALVGLCGTEIMLIEHTGSSVIGLDVIIRWLIVLFGTAIVGFIGSQLRQARRKVMAANESLLEIQMVLAHAGRMAHMGAWYIELLDLDNIDANPLRWSGETYRIFGYEPGSVEVTNALFFEHVHPDDRLRIVEAVAKALDGKHPYEIEHRIERADGTEATVVEHARVIRDERGKPIRLIGAVQDISERKKAQAALERQTAELARSNEELSQFASVIAHDVQQPIVTVGLYLNALRRQCGDGLSGEASESLGGADRLLAHMQGMVRGMLAYARVGSQARPLQPVDADAVLNQALEVFQGEIKRRRAVISHDPLPAVLADAAQLMEIFQNLLGNALKFQVPERPPKVHVGIVPDRTENKVTFYVRDNGVGIDPKYRDQAFQMFKRFHKEEFPGSGVGLATVKKIVERHGGTICLESKPEEGSTFYFTLQRPPLAPKAAKTVTPEP